MVLTFALIKGWKANDNKLANEGQGATRQNGQVEGMVFKVGQKYRDD